MVQVGLVGQRQKRHTINSLPLSTKGISEWHKRLANEILNTGKIKTPSGREFAWPDVQRRRNGSVTYFTQIKNYPVQSLQLLTLYPYL